MDIAQLIKQRAQERGVDPETALAIAKAESGLRTQIKNPDSSAHGLFQIVDDTWKQYGGDFKKRKDVNENIRIGLEIQADNQAKLASTLGRAPQPGELYAAHFFGLAGARRVLGAADYNAPISSVVSKRVMRDNADLLEGKTIGQALGALSQKVGDKGYKEIPRQVDPAAPPKYQENPAQPPVLSRAVDATNQYGPGYQAALALSYLSDTENESDDPDAPSVVEREAQAEIRDQQAVAAAAKARGPSAASMLAKMDFGYAPVVGQPPAAPQAPVGMREGGEVMDPEAALFAGRRDVPAKPNMTGRELAQQALYGVGELPYLMAGAPVDLASLAMMPFGYNDPKPFMGSEDIKARMTRAGIRPADTEEKRLMGPRTAAELLASIVNPAGATRSAVLAAEKGARGAGEAARMLEDATVGNVQRGRVRRAGEQVPPDTAYDPLRERMQASGNLALAVRPPGGNVPEQSLDEIFNSSTLTDSFKSVPLDRRDEIADFIKTKGRKYFEKDFASTSDPLYSALKDGRISPLNSSNVMLRQYMLDAARSGNPEALQDLSSVYDYAIKPKLIKTQADMDNLSYDDRSEKFENAIAAMNERFDKAPGAGNLTPGEKNIPNRFSAVVDQDLFETHYTGRPLTEGELRGVEKGAPFYTFEGIDALPDFVRPDKLAQSFADIPSDRLSKMSYAEAAIEANRFARFRADYGSAIRRVKEGKDVPSEVKLFGTTPLVDAPSGAWHRIVDPAATEMEAAMMGHSIGGYANPGPYGHGGLEAFKSGKAKAYTLRDNKGTAKLTVEALETPDTFRITQIKGKSNEGPMPQDNAEVFLLFDTLNKQRPIDKINTEYYMRSDRNPNAVAGEVNWQKLYDEYRQTKQ